MQVLSWKLARVTKYANRQQSSTMPVQSWMDLDVREDPDFEGPRTLCW